MLRKKPTVNSMKINLIKAILPFLVLFQSFLFKVSLPELVLCFGEDGHVALEGSVKDLDHKHKKDHLNELIKIQQTYNQKHNDCMDINLDWHFSDANILKVKNRIPNYISTLYFPPTLLQISDISLIHTHKVQLNTKAPTITAIQTTVLLI